MTTIPIEWPTEAEIKSVIDRAFAPFDQRTRQLEAAALALSERLRLLEARRRAYPGRGTDDRQLSEG